MKYSAYETNACAALTPEEFDKLVSAAEIYISSQSALNSVISTLGKAVEQGLNKIPANWRDSVLETAREALDGAQRMSITGMDDSPGKESTTWWYTATAIASGTVSGIFGLPAILAEVPATTIVILRSIADIGRSYGERLDDPLFRQTCIEVFAYGGPLEGDEDADLAFIGAKLAVVEMSEFIAKIAVRYASVLAPKIIGMAVPLTGSVVGAGINWAYCNFYQDMARVLFTLLPIERAHDSAQVRSCFASVVQEMKEKQRGADRRRSA